MRNLMALFMAGIVAAEAIAAFVGVIPGGVLHAILLLGLLNCYSFLDELPHREAFLVLALAPLLRLLSLTVPFTQISQIYWYALIGVPLLVAVALAGRFVSLSWAGLKLGRREWWQEGFFAISGIPLGLAGFWILRPRPLILHPNWGWILVASAILIVFVGFTEEVIFRGMLQQAAVEIFGRYGILIVSALYASLYLGSLSWGFVLFIGMVGLIFSLWVKKTGSIWGVVAAHSILSIEMILAAPALWP